jgi:two-component sensor histidine kinase
MILHELATNAVKYGALSNESGRVSITWDVVDVPEDDGVQRRCVHLVWREIGGPAVRTPEKKGFGSTLIERALEGNHGTSRIEFTPTGVVCSLAVTL